MYYLIYKITNKLNNKIYIGAHKTKNKEDDYFGSGLLLERAVDKHSQQNFVKEILFELPTKEEMWQKEAEIVNEAFISRDDTYKSFISFNNRSIVSLGICTLETSSDVGVFFFIISFCISSSLGTSAPPPAPPPAFTFFSILKLYTVTSVDTSAMYTIRVLFLCCFYTYVTFR